MLEWIRRSEVAICYQKRTKTSEAIRKKTTVDLGQRKNKVAESWGFEPQIPFWGIHDFQSCSFGQLGHLSVLPIAAAKYYT